MRSHRRIRPGRCLLFGSTGFPTAPSLTSNDEPPYQPRESGHQDRKQRVERSRKELSSQVPKLRQARNVEAGDGGEGLEHEIRNGERGEKDGRDRGDLTAAPHPDRRALIVHGLGRRDECPPPRACPLPVPSFPATEQP